MNASQPAFDLHRGDCLDVLPCLPSASIDLVLADLPYGTTACAWDSLIDLDRLWPALYRVGTRDCAFVLTATQPFTSVLVTSNLRAFKHEWVWQKSRSGSAFAARHRPMAKHESVLVFCRGRLCYRPQMVPGTPYSKTRRAHPVNHHRVGLNRVPGNVTVNAGTRYPDSVIAFSTPWRRQDQLHSTQKPVALMRYLVRTYSDPGQTVLDCSMGSGTTGVAALAEGRRFVGIERDPAYFDLSTRRLASGLLGDVLPANVQAAG